MNNNFKNHRRAFIKKSLTISAGVVLIGSGIKVFAQQPDEWRWVAFCCKRCDTCGAYLKKECGSSKSFLDKDAICQKGCALKKGVPTCALCDEFDSCKHQGWIDSPKRRKLAQELRNKLIVNGKLKVEK